MAKTVTFKNLFSAKSDDKFTLTCSDDSYNILNTLSNIYNFVVKFFSNIENKNSFKKALSVVEEFKSFSLNTSGNSIISRTNQELLTALKGIEKEDCINNILKGKDKENYGLFVNLLALILYFTAFVYDTTDSINPLANSLSEDIVSSNGDYICISSSNNYFNLLNKINNSWSTNSLEGCIWDDNSTKIEINSPYSCLTSGKYKSIALFNSETDVKKWIYYNTIITGAESMFRKINSFEFTVIPYMLTRFSETVYNVLKSESELAVADVQVESNPELKSYEFYFDSSNKNKKIKLTACDGNILEAYKKIYDYGISLLNAYVEKRENKTSNPYEDEYIKKLIKKIAGLEPSSVGTFSRVSEFGSFLTGNDYKLRIFDYDNNGISISSCIAQGTQIPSNGTFYGEREKLIENSPDNIKNKTYDLISHITFDLENENTIKEYTNTFGSSSAKNRPFYFYEMVKFNNIPNVKSELSKIKEQIDDFCKIGNNLISRILFFAFYHFGEGKLSYERVNFVNESGKTYKKSSIKSTWTLISSVYGVSSGYIEYDGVSYSNMKTAYQKILEDTNGIQKYFSELLEYKKNESTSNDKNTATIEAAERYEEYVKSRFATGYFTEKDYFYINDKGARRVPSNVFVDVEFRVAKYVNGSATATYLPVSSMRYYDEKENVDLAINNNDGLGDLHAGTYFDSFELEDEGGTKKITLTLKSSNDMNLERIIYSSLSLDNKLKMLGSNDDITEYISNIIQRTEANFRIRFGYRDVAFKDKENNDTSITATDVSDNDFINRTKATEGNNGEVKVKPVQVYPWTYFNITGLTTEIKDGTDIYTITAVSSGSYVLESLSLCGISSNFSTDTANEEFFGSPKNVAGKLAKWITQASCKNNDITSAKIAFLGDLDGTIITDFDNDGFNKYYYKLKNGNTLSGGSLESIESKFFNTSQNSLLDAKNFNINNSSTTYSVKDLLDNLIDWLPSRVYYIAKVNNETAALMVSYDTIASYNSDNGNFFSQVPFKTEKLKYQIIEAEAIISESNTFNNSSIDVPVNLNPHYNDTRKDFNDYHKVYFIRMYYEGPGRTATDANGVDNNTSDYIRIYNYRSLQEQVIQEINISSESELGNTVDAVTIIGSGIPLIFAYNEDTGTMCRQAAQQNKDDSASEAVSSIVCLGDTYSSAALDNSENEKKITPYFSMNNSKYVVSNIKSDDSKETVQSTYSQYQIEASRFFTAQQNKQYSGEMTIMGDPFYYFDSSVEAGKYEIYLQMNRVSDYKTYEMTPSRYTGIYFLTGIKHSIDSSGNFTTTLSITKRIFGSSDSSSS